MPKSETGDFGDVFDSLKGVLKKHAGALAVSDDTSTKYCLAAQVGPATLRSWGGKVRRRRIPVAWVEIGKSYVSYHLMGIAVPTVQAAMSISLKARMQGKTCFNFTTNEPVLFSELDKLTEASIEAFRTAAFIA
jgi:hypothetical protein